RHHRFLLSSSDEQLPALADFADVSGMEPSILERTRGFVGGVEVAGRHVVAAHENLSIGRNLHLDAGDGFADRAALGPERMVQRDDRRRFRQAVTLNHCEAAFAPERLELALDWPR